MKQKIPEAEYHQKMAFSASNAAKLAKSPATLRYSLDNPETGDTPAMALGRAVHCAILEPDLFWAKFAVAPEGDRRTKAGKEAFSAFDVENANKGIITMDQAEKIFAMQTAVFGCASAAHFLRMAGEVEMSYEWTCAETGVLCKARVDKLVKDPALVIDLKTTRDASNAEFQRSVLNFGYHRQAALYLEATGATRFLIVAVESEAPYLTACYEVDAESIQQGAAEIRALKELWKKCLEINEWPGYPDRVEMIGLPEWFKRKAVTANPKEIQF